MNKGLLVVGAGFGQIPAILEAKKLNLEVITVDKDPYAKGMGLADYSYPVDIIDRDAVLEIAKKHNVGGVITMQSDLPVPTIGYINDVLGLNGVSMEVANFCSNKMETRKRLELKDAAQPKFKIVKTLDETKKAVMEIGLPCVIKSADNSGSRGVTKVNFSYEIENAYKEAFKYTRKDSILVEEYIKGVEFGAQTFSVNGKCELVLLHNDTMSNPPYMIPVGHSFPFVQLSKEDSKTAISDIKNAIEAIGITNGPANVDLILDETTNRVKVIEIGARIGATCLPELVYYHTGINWVKSTILNAIGVDVDLTPITNRAVAAIIIEAPEDGVHMGYETKEGGHTRCPLLDFEITKSPGDQVNILRKGTDRIGKIISYGSTASIAEKIVSEYRDNLIIKVEK